MAPNVSRCAEVLLLPCFTFQTPIQTLMRASVVEYIAPAPAVCAAPTPVVWYVSPAPAGYAAPAPVVDYKAPVVEDFSLAPGDVCPRL